MHQVLISRLPKKKGWRSCKFERNRSIAAKIPRVFMVQCLKTPKTHSTEDFWREKRNFFPYKFAFCNVATPGASNGAFVLWDSLSSKTHKKITKRLSADMKVKNKTTFWNFLVRKASPLQKNAFFIVATNCASINASILWVSLSSDSCGKFPKRFTADQRTPQKTHFDVFFSARTEHFCLIIAFLLLQHLVQPNGRPFGEFHYHRIHTKNSEAF